jgi:hypothetical protein
MTADTVATALLRTVALYLAEEEKAEKFRKPSKEPSTFLVELLMLIIRERKRTETQKESKIR